MSGLAMLVLQAVAAAEIFWDETISASVGRQIERELSVEKENIVLIGMPGVGKTTTGIALASEMGRPFYDIDEMIVSMAGKSIPEIFAEDGEDAFRQAESEAARELSKVTGAVIACGGGVVNREENYYTLAENGHIVFLNRDISLLPTDGRPVSQAVPPERLYRIRLPLYRSWCDDEIEITGNSPEETAAHIMDMGFKGYKYRRKSRSGLGRDFSKPCCEGWDLSVGGSERNVWEYRFTAIHIHVFDGIKIDDCNIAVGNILKQHIVVADADEETVAVFRRVGANHLLYTHIAANLRMQESVHILNGFIVNRLFVLRRHQRTAWHGEDRGLLTVVFQRIDIIGHVLVNQRNGSSVRLKGSIWIYVRRRCTPCLRTKPYAAVVCHVVCCGALHIR